MKVAVFIGQGVSIRRSTISESNRNWWSLKTRSPTVLQSRARTKTLMKAIVFTRRA